MTEAAFNALRAAVTYARNSPRNVKLAEVRTRLSIMGYSDEIICEALEAWAVYCKHNPPADDY
ncbi:hypothetical protein [Achromobacter sp. ACRQX]|uniref:hypothetical protein n=1 Tax=Achromobacter sp. ACRQX TaxID=2918181 RepID=UPI001EF16CB8|nr:hypothetical protein [Achromobacter sp. ACRQX]MCG7328015.1 hypothetical protein [Achromobacter sp. ACRQX]